ncbi:hypothetical protein [Spirosoma spitsbergense]|uniref:hypothetical protein n=1 Tax=Spirosoma spitsbergense TaxID=431554 RepID=UPI001FE056A3|nr:hypothetical protein [Spirosoma spitsbergense]
MTHSGCFGITHDSPEPHDELVKLKENNETLTVNEVSQEDSSNNRRYAIVSLRDEPNG